MGDVPAATLLPTHSEEENRRGQEWRGMVMDRRKTRLRASERALESSRLRK